MGHMMMGLQQGFVTGEIGFRVRLQSSNPEPLMSALGQKRASRQLERMSALPPKADIVQHRANVRFVPKADVAPVRSTIRLWEIGAAKRHNCCVEGAHCSVASGRNRGAPRVRTSPDVVCW
jgi:hypothetical protein